MMQKVRCVDCGKTYDYDEDAFCPKCGAFNQPARTERRAPAMRVDGLSEAGHRNSFLHREFHEEERVRRRIGLDKSVDRSGLRRPSQGPAPQAARQPVQRKKQNLVSVLAWIIAAIIALNVLSNFLLLLF